MALDYPSILFFLVMSNVFIITLFTYEYFYHHKEWYLSVFIVGISFRAIAIILVGYRNVLPFLFTVQISNLFLISSFALTSFGLLSFDGKMRKNILWLFFVVTIFFCSSFLAVGKNDTIRIIIQIVASSFFYGIGAFYLFINKKKYKFSVILSIILLIYSIFQLIRAVIIYQTGQSYDFMKGSTIDNWYLVISLFAISSSSIGFIMLLKEIDKNTILLKNIRIQQDKLKLEGLNKTKDKLFSIIAHDLKSPLNSILGFSELLNNKIQTSDIEKSKKFATIINTSAKNNLRLLDNIMTWAKTQTEQIEFIPENLKLYPIVEETLLVLNSSALLKNIKLISSLPDDIVAYADRIMLSTILRNLISNAIKFTNLGGKIDISAVSQQDHVEISVADNGVGISEENQKKLFGADVNFTMNGTENESGTGLGLMLCKEFVEKHGGRIWVESKLGKGSDFKFTLPLS
jgi:signal transduction histidine kinase